MYFGIVNKLKEESLSDEQIQEYLKKKGVLENVTRRVSASFNLGSEPSKPTFIEENKNRFFSKNPEYVFKPKYSSWKKKVLINLNDAVINKSYSTSFKKEVYYYITNLFEGIINVKFQLLSDSLNKDIEVHTDKLKIDEVIKVLFIETFRGLVDESSSGSSVVSNLDKLPERKPYFYYLKEEQSQLINNIEQYPILIDSYLDGNENLIINELLTSCKVVQDIIDFDFNYKFLLALNKKYNIEDASKDIIDEKYYHIHSQFKDLFESVEVVVFSYDKINGFIELFPANISSLFYALTKCNLITNNKSLFQRYVLKTHGISVSKIREDTRHGLTPFRVRLNQFLDEIYSQNLSKRT